MLFGCLRHAHTLFSAITNAVNWCQYLQLVDSELQKNLYAESPVKMMYKTMDKMQMLRTVCNSSNQNRELFTTFSQHTLTRSIRCIAFAHTHNFETSERSEGEENIYLQIWKFMWDKITSSDNASISRIRRVAWPLQSVFTITSDELFPYLWSVISMCSCRREKSTYLTIIIIIIIAPNNNLIAMREISVECAWHKKI